MTNQTEKKSPGGVGNRHKSKPMNLAGIFHKKENADSRANVMWSNENALLWEVEQLQK